MGGRGRVPIETSGAIPTHGGASRADFAKVSPGQGGAGEVHPFGTGGALELVLTYLVKAHGAGVTWEAPRRTWLKKARWWWGNPGEGWRGSRRRNGETGLCGGASLTLGAAHWATPTHCSASCTDCAKVSTGKVGAEEVHPLEANRTLKGVSAHIKVTDGAGVPGARMVTDGARVRMDIATNKEQSQD